jgi:LCP family protein required for cell wall assembly
MVLIMKEESPKQPKRRPPYRSVDGFITPKPQPTAPSRYHDLSQISASAHKIKTMPRKPTHAPSHSGSQESKSLLNTTLPGGASSLQSRQQLADNDSVKPKRGLSRLWRRSGKRWSWKRRITTTFALIIVAAVALGGWDVWQLSHKVNHLTVGNLAASVGGAENILVAGSTNRCNLKVQNAQWGFCSQGVTGVNSDVIFIIHIVPKTRTVSLLSIPRDTFVPNARSGDEAFKIDAALYQGPTQLVNAVEEDFAIPIQHYAEVGFDGFVNIVNAVGGVKMYFPMPVYDSESYLDVKTPGCKLLNGVEALQVVRARHLQYDPPGLATSDVYLWPQEVESDIARIARTHEFLRVLASTVAAKGLSNPITDQKLVDAIAPQVQVDSGLSTSAMLQLMEDFHAVNINSVPQYTLPISTTAFGDYDYGGTNYGDVVFPAESVDQQTIDKFLGESSTTDTMTGKPLPSPSSVTVNVVNGSGTPDQASDTTQDLQALGFSMTGQPGTTMPLSSEAVETVVNYASPRTEADAEAVARQLSGPVILSQNASQVTPGSEVTVQTGTGLVVNGSSTSSSSGSATTGSSTTSTSSSSSTANSTAATGLEPASSAMQALSAWDPRACTK